MLRRKLTKVPPTWSLAVVGGLPLVPGCPFLTPEDDFQSSRRVEQAVSSFVGATAVTLTSAPAVSIESGYSSGFRCCRSGLPVSVSKLMAIAPKTPSGPSCGKCREIRIPFGGTPCIARRRYLGTSANHGCRTCLVVWDSAISGRLVTGYRLLRTWRIGLGQFSGCAFIRIKGGGHGFANYREPQAWLGSAFPIFSA